MKKIVAVCTGIVMAASVMALAACGDVGVVKGDFSEEATAEETKVALASVDVSTLFGDETAESFGLQFLTDLDFSMDMSTKISEDLQTSTSVKGNFDVDYKAVTTYSETDISTAGAGSFNLALKSVIDSETENETYKGKVYMDSDYVYLSSNVEGMEKVKYTIDSLLEEVMGSVSGMIPVNMSLAASTDAEIESTLGMDLDFDSIVEQLEGIGFKFYIDDSKGLKVKISATTEAIEQVADEIIATAMGGGVSLPTSMLNVNVKSSVFDFYLAIDEDGKFSQVSFNSNLNIEISMSEYMSGSLSLKGGVALKAYNGTVKLPSGIESDESYLLTNV